MILFELRTTVQLYIVSHPSEKHCIALIPFTINKRLTRDPENDVDKSMLTAISSLISLRYKYIVVLSDLIADIAVSNLIATFR